VHILKSYGFSEAVYVEDADVVLVNTCAFLAASLGELDEVLSEIIDSINPKKTRVVVTGCVMNRALAEFQELFPEVNKWIALKDFAAFEKYLLRYVLPKGIKPRVVDLEGREMLDQDGLFAYLRISDGCENYCSYCMIPSIRGKLVSEPIEKLVEEAGVLPQGQRVGADRQDSCLYGTDLYGERHFGMIEKLHEIPVTIGFASCTCIRTTLNREWTSLWHRFPKLLPYFEIPIQM
jgi:ribosomal protein S12 methylthiotransferase